MEVSAPSSEVELYQSADGSVTLEVKTDDDTVWLTQAQLSALFGRDRTVIARHVANAKRDELSGNPVSALFAHTADDGKTYQVEHYNLDTIISVGYRVKSTEGVRFRRWASDVLKRYLDLGGHAAG
ncbi:RhuM family protein [Gryllotalpicola protaetiae]|uniref:Virulence factor n=1 Tax=Gryllotalpicola protaetiae TaxID=2419771 RepID=A0A387BP16_9MICO|nr:RhuM family protein [Gryllotalpicola protaetiae]AYG04458.1 virulence factor [Gryllotalpicola protaetiae]